MFWLIAILQLQHQCYSIPHQLGVKPIYSQKNWTNSRSFITTKIFSLLQFQNQVNEDDLIATRKLRCLTFVPKSVKAIAMLFFAISKFGDTAKHLEIHKKRTQSDAETKIMFLHFPFSWLNLKKDVVAGPLVTGNCRL